MALFISLEGPDGSGKTTQARLLAAALRARARSVVETREPGGTRLGERIREIWLEPEVTPLVMALLLSASRAQLLHSVILPALGRGDTVVCDRYADSTIAYQSFGLGLALPMVRDLTAIATNGVRPDAVVWVDVPPETCLARLRRRHDTDRLDQLPLAFHQRVRDGYTFLMEQEPDRWIRVDGTHGPEHVHFAIMQALEPFLGGTSTS